MSNIDLLRQQAFDAADDIAYGMVDFVDHNMSVLKDVISEIDKAGLSDLKQEVVSEISHILCDLNDLGDGALKLAYYHDELTSIKKEQI